MKRPVHWRWRRRLLILAAAVIAGRVVLAVLLPWLVDVAAGSAGLTASCRSASLSLHSLSLRLQDLVLRDARGGPILASARDVSFDLSTWQLLHGELVVVDAALAGCAIELVRAADGTFVLPPELTAGAAPAPAAAPPPAAAPGDADFALPFAILHARVHDLRVRYRDETPLQRTTDLVLDVDLVDLGHRERPSRIDLRAHSPQLCERLTLVGQATTTAQRLAVAFQVTARGIARELSGLDDGIRADIDLRGNLAAERDAAHPGGCRVAADLQATVGIDGREHLALRASLGPSVPTDHGLSAPFSIDVRSKGLVDQLELADGRVDLGAERVEIGARLLCRKLTLGALTPWLAQHGIAIAEAGIDATARLHATLPREPGGASAARLEGLSLRSGEQQCEFASLAIDGMRTKAPQIEIDSITADGPVLGLQRHADGAFGVAGLQFRPPARPAKDAPLPSPPATATTVLLHKLDWHGARIQFTDLSLPSPTSISVQDLAVTGDNFLIDGERSRAHGQATLRADGAVQSLRAEVHLAPATGATEAEVHLEASGIVGKAMAPWSTGLGITPTVQDGRLSLTGKARFGTDRTATTIDAQLADLRFEDRGEVLLSLRNAEVSGMRCAPDAIDLGTVRIDEPVVAVQTNADGTRTVCGLLLQPPPVAAKHQPDAPAGPASPAAQLASLTLAGATLRFCDLRPGEATLAVGLDATLGAMRGDGTPTPVTATLRLEQAIEALELHGQIAVGPGETRVAAELSGRGIHGAVLTPLLPESLSSPLADGALRASVNVRWQQLATGHSLDAALSGVALTDGTTELLGIDELVLRVPEFSARRIHVAALQLRGVRAIASATDQGLHVPGLLLRPSPIAAAVATEPAAMVAPPAPPWPELRIDELDLLCDRFVFRDRRNGEHEPLVVSARLHLEQPWATAADLAQTAAARFSVQATASPICQQLTAGASLRPFLLAPDLELELRAEGLDPTALARIAPATGQPLAGTTSNAVLTAKVHATIDLHRRDARRFDFSRPFGGRLLVEQLALREAADGASLLAVDAIDIAARAIDPRTGDVLLKSVEIDAPVLAVKQTAQGLHVAGFVFPQQGAEPAPATGAPPAGPAPELAIDRLRLHGLALDYRDDTTSPVTHLPVQELDLDLQRFSTRAMTEARPFSFDLQVRGGDVQLDRRIVRSSMLAGLVGTTAEMVTGAANVHEQEPRPLVDEIAVTGQLQLFPMAKGSLRATVHAFELPALRGLARSGAVEISDGLLDASLTLQMHGGAGTDVRSVSTFTWLALSEPPGGPISTYLKLPAPLDTVLFLLRNEADEQRLPVQLHVPASGAPASAIAEAIIEALALVIGDAVARSPLRLLSVLQAGVGLAPQKQVNASAVLPCAPGVTQPDLAGLASLLATTSGDPACTFVIAHELGAADLEHAARLANPPAAAVRASIARLQRRHEELDRARPALAADTAAAYAAGHIQQALVHHGELRSLDTRLGELQATLDEALAMLTETGPRAAARRTRQAAAAIGEARIEAVRAAMADQLGKDAARRIEVRRARGVPLAGVKGGGAVVVTARR